MYMMVFILVMWLHKLSKKWIKKIQKYFPLTIQDKDTYVYLHKTDHNSKKSKTSNKFIAEFEKHKDPRNQDPEVKKVSRESVEILYFPAFKGEI